MVAGPDSTPDSREPDSEDEQGTLAADAFDLDALRARQDVPGLLALAKAHRAGTAPGGRDLARCLEAYRAAALLGSGEAEYAVALFLLNGGPVVPQDLKEGTMRLRSAAEKGSIPAKIYLGNLYELGIHYKTDPEKADVWYRNAARAAGVDAEPGSPAWDRALAELGGARQALLLGRDTSLDEAERARLLARAKAHGYGLRVRDGSGPEGDRPTFQDALGSVERQPVMAPLATPPRERKDTSPETRQAKEKKSLPPPPPAPDPKAQAEAERKARVARREASERKARVAGALGAFGYALLFVIAGAGAGYAATLGAEELVARGHALPLLGTRTRYVFPIVLGAVGVVPTWLVYRFGAVLKALVMGAALAGVGWVAWGTGRATYHGDRPVQALAFGVAGFFAALLVLGLVGGAKAQGKRRSAD
ncbi:MAG: hypothetical protein JWP97_6036 [Labilithrix sp.]|nr:hypothetical protein [Labilithrix sp.]